MNYQGKCREFIFETTWWKRLRPSSAVERAVRLRLESLPGRVSSALTLQHSFGESLSFMGTQFSYQSTQVTDSNTPKFPPVSDKVFMKDRGPYPWRLRLNLHQCWHCLHFYTTHLFIMCLRVQSETRHSAGETEVTDATVRVLAERGDTAPFKATLKTFFLLQTELPSRQRARPATASHLCGRH